MAEICIGCGLRVDPETGRLVANVSEWPDEIPDNEREGDVYCDEGTGLLKVRYIHSERKVVTVPTDSNGYANVIFDTAFSDVPVVVVNHVAEDPLTPVQMDITIDAISTLSFIVRMTTAGIPIVVPVKLSYIAMDATV